MKQLAIVAGILAASVAVAHAEPRVDATTPTEVADDRSPALALGLSVGATALGTMVTLLDRQHGAATGIGLTLAVLGPSTGEWYAGKTGAIGIGLRVGGALTALYGAVTAFPNADRGHGQESRDLIYAGAAMWVGGTVLDWYEAYHQTSLHNERVRAAMTPTVVPTASGAMAPGMAFTGKF